MHLEVQYLLGLRPMPVDPLGKLHMGTKPLLHQLRVVVEELRADDQMASDELSLRPQVSFIEKPPAVPFPAQARGPGLRRPGRIPLLFQKLS